MAIESEIVRLAEKIVNLEHAMLNLRKDVEFVARQIEDGKITEGD